jgi:hypothetical protein
VDDLLESGGKVPVGQPSGGGDFPLAKPPSATMHSKLPNDDRSIVFLFLS